jgi:hypothetical protein
MKKKIMDHVATEAGKESLDIEATNNEPVANPPPAKDIVPDAIGQDSDRFLAVLDDSHAIHLRMSEDDKHLVIKATSFDSRSYGSLRIYETLLTESDTAELNLLKPTPKELMEDIKSALCGRNGCFMKGQTTEDAPDRLILHFFLPVGARRIEFDIFLKERVQKNDRVVANDVGSKNQADRAVQHILEIDYEERLEACRKKLKSVIGAFEKKVDELTARANPCDKFVYCETTAIASDSAVKNYDDCWMTAIVAGGPYPKGVHSIKFRVTLAGDDSPAIGVIPSFLDINNVGFKRGSCVGHTVYNEGQALSGNAKGRYHLHHGESKPYSLKARTGRRDYVTMVLDMNERELWWCIDEEKGEVLKLGHESYHFAVSMRNVGDVVELVHSEHHD